MPESPDFDAIARRLTDQANTITPLTKGMIYYDIKDELRQVWNARGAADVDAIESPFMGLGPFYEKVRDAIRSLNR